MSTDCLVRHGGGRGLTRGLISPPSCIMSCDAFLSEWSLMARLSPAMISSIILVISYASTLVLEATDVDVGYLIFHYDMTHLSDTKKKNAMCTAKKGQVRPFFLITWCVLSVGICDILAHPAGLTVSRPAA